MTLSATGPWPRRCDTVLADEALTDEEHAAPARLAARLGRMLDTAGCSGRRTRVVLADGLVRLWMVAPPRNGGTLADCRAAAALRYQNLFGESVADWQVVADWDARRAFLACAMPKALLGALVDTARERRLSLLEIAPQFVIAWNRWRAKITEDAWFAPMHGNVLTIGVSGRHGLLAVREITLPDPAPCDQRGLPRLVANEALRLNVATPKRILLCGQVPEHWGMHAIDGVGFARLDRSATSASGPHSVAARPAAARSGA